MAGVEAHINVFIIPRQMSIHTTIHSPVYITTAYCLFYPLFELRSLQCCPPLEKNTKNVQIVFISNESKTFTYFLVVRSLSSFEEISPPFIHFAVVVFGLFAFCVSVFCFFWYFYSVWMMLLFDVFVSAFFAL